MMNKILLLCVLMLAISGYTVYLPEVINDPPWEEAQDAWAEEIASQPLTNACGQLDDDGYND